VGERGEMWGKMCTFEAENIFSSKKYTCDFWER
jgi:hypothetical protein